jgi:hypothetical protein
MVFKPQYALPLGVVALAEGRWRIIAGEAGTFAACSLISGLLFGFETWGAFLDALGRANDTVDYMSNWYAWAFLAGAKPSVQIAGIPVMAAGALLIAAYAASVPAGANAWLHKLAFAAALAPIVSANTHPYDLSFLVFPVLAAVWLHGGRWRIVRALQTERSNAATIAVVVVLFCSTTTFLLTHRPMLLAVELLVLVAVVAVRLRSATTQHVPGEHTTLSRPPTYTTAGTAETSACAE